MTIWSEPRFLPCGDRALSVELGDEITRDINARILALEYLLQQKRVPGVGETVPSYRALLVYYDPLVVGYEELTATLRGLLAEARPEVLPPVRTVELPCCYGGELGFELEAAAAKLGLAPEEMARLHAEADYYVYFVGFTPGLPVHDRHARAPDDPAPDEPAPEDPARQREHRGRAVLHLLGGEPGRLLGARPHAGAPLRSDRAPIRSCSARAITCASARSTAPSTTRSRPRSTPGGTRPGSPAPSTTTS